MYASSHVLGVGEELVGKYHAQPSDTLLLKLIDGQLLSRQPILLWALTTRSTSCTARVQINSAGYGQKQDPEGHRFNMDRPDVPGASLARRPRGG